MLVNCLIVAMIWGLTPIINKYILQSIEVESLMIFSGLFYGLFAILYGTFIHHNKVITDVLTLSKVPHKWGLMAINSFLILIVADFLYLRVIRDHKTYLATAITASYPLFTVVAGFLLFNEVISVAHFVGILLIIGGIYTLNAFE